MRSKMTHLLTRRRLLTQAAFAASPLVLGAKSAALAQGAATPQAAPEGRELPVRRVPNAGMAAEFYFSPDGKSIIGTSKGSDDAWHVHGQMLLVDGGMSAWQQPDLPENWA